MSALSCRRIFLTVNIRGSLFFKNRTPNSFGFFIFPRRVRTCFAVIKIPLFEIINAKPIGLHNFFCGSSHRNTRKRFLLIFFPAQCFNILESFIQFGFIAFLLTQYPSKITQRFKIMSLHPIFHLLLHSSNLLHSILI